MAKAGIPTLVKHVALAIFKSGDLKGNKFKKTQAAFDIARSRLVEYGYLKKGSEQGPPENIKLTGKGHKREGYHRNEGGEGKSKTTEWDQLYSLIQETEEEAPGEEGVTEEAAPVGTPPRQVRKQQTKQRRARAARSSPKRRTKRRRVTKAKRAKRG